MQLPLDPLCVVIRDVGFNSSNQALGGENTEAEAIIDRITYDGYDINIEYTDPANAVSMRKIYSNLKPID